MFSGQIDETLVMASTKSTVKPAQTTTFIKRPPAINDHFYSPLTIYTIYFNWIQRPPA